MNLEDFKNNKLTCLLKKSRSPLEVKIVEDLDDPYFFHIIMYRPKTKKVKSAEMIIRPDLPGWISYLGSLGYVEPKK